MDKIIASNKRIAKNTFLLYIRMLLSLIIGLYTVRVILRVLGIQDYGIYNVVAGLVTSLAFLSNTTSSAIQRFLSFSLGQDDKEKYKSYFLASKYVFYGIASITLVLAETIGLGFLVEYLVIPPERLEAAIWVYESCLVSLIFSFLLIPYNAVIISFEKMNIFAGIGIVDVFLKLGIAYLIMIFPFDSLKTYAVLLAGVSVLNFIFYRYYAYRTAGHLLKAKVLNKQHLHQILGFTGWNLFGSVSGLVRGQGLNILINLYFGPIFNAARGIAYQIYNVVNGFCSNFMMAVNPQIIKLYSTGNKTECFKLVHCGAKISFSLLLVFSFPLMVLMPYVLNLWLVEYPPATILFARLVLLNMLVESLSQPLLTLAQASGKVKYYQIVVGGSLILNLPLSILAYEMGMPPETCFFIMIVMNAIAIFLRLLVLKRTAGIELWPFVIHVCARAFMILTIMFFIYVVLLGLNDIILLLTYTLVTSAILVPILAMFLLFSKKERTVAMEKARKHIGKFL